MVAPVLARNPGRLCLRVRAGACERDRFGYSPAWRRHSLSGLGTPVRGPSRNFLAELNPINPRF